MARFRSLKSFVEKATKNERFVYHRGLLGLDRNEDRNVAEKADMALDYYTRGFIELFQAKKGPSDYEYIAVRTMDIGLRPWIGCYSREDEE